MTEPFKLTEEDKYQILSQCPGLGPAMTPEVASLFELERYDRGEHVYSYAPIMSEPPLRQLGVILAGHVVVHRHGCRHPRRTCAPMMAYGEEFCVAWWEARGDEQAQRASLREATRAIAAEPTWALELAPSMFERAFPPGSALMERLRAGKPVTDLAPEIVAVLSATPELANVEDDDLYRLLEAAELLAVTPGEPVLRCGQRPDGIYVLLEGGFNFIMPGAGAPTAKVQAPAAAGAAELIHGRPMLFDVVASGAARAVRIAGDMFWHLFRLDPDFQRAIVRTNNLPAGDGYGGSKLAAGVFLVLPDFGLREDRPDVAAAIPGLTDLLAERIATHLFDNVLVLHVRGASVMETRRRFDFPDGTWVERRVRGIPGDGIAALIKREMSAEAPGEGGAPDVTLVDIVGLEDPLPAVRQFCGMDVPHKVVRMFCEPGAPPPLPVLISRTEVVHTAVLREGEAPEGIGNALHRAGKQRGALGWIKAAVVDVPAAAVKSVLGAGERAVESVASALPGRSSARVWPMGTVRIRPRKAVLAALQGEGGEAQSFEALGRAVSSEDVEATRGTIDRWARAVTSRRVGISLGGGGTYGDVHIPLLQRLEKEGIPIDVISGASVGSTIGAYYAALGKAGLDLFWDHRGLLLRASLLSFVSSAVLEWAIAYDLGGVRLEETETPFFPVVTEGDLGVEWDVREGTYALGVRASGSLPPFIAPTVVDGRRYLDGGLVANVPVNVLRDEGASLIIASNPIASVKPRDHGPLAQIPVVGDLLQESNPVLRVEDTLRMIPLIFRTTGEAQTGGADVTYRPAAGDSSLASTVDESYVKDAQTQLALNQAVAEVQSRWRKMLRRPPGRVRLSADGARIECSGVIFFTGAGVAPQCAELLDEIAAFLEEHVHIKKVRAAVTAATASIAQARALALAAYLASAGVEEHRLDASGGRAAADQEEAVDLLVIERAATEEEIEELRSDLQRARDELAAAERERARAEAAARARALTLAAAWQCARGDLDLACLLGIEAARLDRGLEAGGVLRAALRRSGRLVARLPGAAPARELAIGPDGRLAAIGGSDGIVRIWDMGRRAGAAPIAEIDHRGAADPGIRGVAWSPDGRLLATAGFDWMIRIHEVRDDGAVAMVAQASAGTWDQWGVAFCPDPGRPLVLATVDGERSVLGVLAIGPAGMDRVATLDHGGQSVIHAAWSPDGGRVAVATAGGVTVWSVGAGAERIAEWTAGRGPALRAAWHEDGERLAIASGRGASVHALPRGTAPEGAAAPVRFEVSGHEAHVSAVAWSPGGDRLVTASADGTARIWDAEGGAFRMILRGYDGPLAGAAWHPREDLVATWSESGVAVIWAAQSGEPRAHLFGHEGSITRGAWRPDGGLLVTTSVHGGTRAWDALACGQVSHGKHGGPLSVAAWHPTDRALALTAALDGSVHCWDPQTGAQIRVLFEGRGGAPGAAFAAWSPDGLAAAAIRAGDDRPTLWDARSSWTAREDLARSERAGLAGRGAPPRLAFSPCGALLAVKHRRTVTVWDLQTGAIRGEIEAREDLPWVAWGGARPGSEEGLALAVSRWASRGSVELYDPRDLKEPILKLGDTTDGVWCIDFSPDGRRVATACNDSRAWIHDAQTGELIKKIDHGAPVRAIAWSPDGRFLATGDGALTAAIYRAERDRFDLCSAPEQHRNEVRHIAWTRDGRRLLSASADGTVRVWEERDAGGGARIWSTAALLEGHRDAIRCAAPSPDGADAITAGEDGIAIVHPIDFDVLVGRVAGLLDRFELTEEEWGRYMGPAAARRPTWPIPAR